ncbi:caspase family protein [Psychroserpens sp. MEBiC05023]
MMNLQKLTVFLFLTASTIMVSSAQNLKPVLQKPFENGIENIVINNEKTHFLTAEGDIKTIGGLNIKLWDYDSKIIIAEKYFQSENGPGAGKIELKTNGTINLSLNHSIISINLITNKVDTIFKSKWPEYILNYKQLDNNLLVSTKIYPKKDGRINEVTNNSNLYSVDLTNKKNVTKKNFPLELTCINFSEEFNTFFLGTNKGECLFFNNKLETTYNKIKFFKNEVIKSLHLLPNGYLAANSLSISNKKEYDLRFSGEGLIEIRKIDDPNIRHSIILPKQHPPETEYTKRVSGGSIKFSENNSISSISTINQSELLISFGYNKFAVLNVTDGSIHYLDTESIDYAIGKVVINPSTKELLFSGGELSLLTIYDDLYIYNYKNEKITEHLKERELTLNRTKTLVKASNTYYFAEYPENNYANIDSITLQPLDYRENKTLHCDNCEFRFDLMSETLIIKRGEYIAVGKPNNNFNNKKNIQFNLNIDHEYLSSDSDDLTTIVSLDDENYLDDIKYFNLKYEKDKYNISDIYHYVKNSNTFIASVFHEKKHNWQLASVDSKGEIIQIYGESFETELILSPNGEFLAVLDQSGKNYTTLNVYRTKDYSLIINYQFCCYSSSGLNFDLNSEFVYFQEETYDEDKNEVYSLNSIEISKGISSLKQIHKGLYYPYFIVDEDKSKLYINSTSFIKKIDLKTNMILFEKSSDFPNNDTKVHFYGELNKIVIDNGGYLTIFDRNSDNYIEYYFLSKQNTIGISSDNYYIVSPGLSLDNFGFSYNTKGYSFSQFDLVFNRPDKILEYLNFPNEGSISLFKKAYKKRIKQIGFNPNDISKKLIDLPTSSFSFKNSELTTQEKTLKVKVHLKDENSTLKSWNIWVNGVPHFGSRGKTLPINQHEYKTEIEIPLSVGKNNIEISCINNNQLESLRKTKSIVFDALPYKANLIFVGLGVSKYQDSTYNLDYATKDVLDLNNIIKEQTEKYQSIESLIFLDKNLNQKNLKKIRTRLKNTKIEDKIIIFYAGHGIIDNNLNYYLSTSEMDFKNPMKGGLLYKDLEGLLDGVPSRKKMILIDACNSGEIELENTVITDKPNLKKDDTGKKKGSISLSTKDENTINSFEFMQQWFSDIRLGNGATIISSSGGLESAYEGDKWKNGAFTYALIDCLKTKKCDLNKDNKIYISEIKEYLSIEVPKITNGKQKPTSRNLNLIVDFEF